MEKPVSAVHVKISGRVQGVGFRYSTLRQAERYGISGWVRNAFDGDVEVFCEGDRDKVSAFLKWLEMGPRGAYVSNVVSRKCPARGYSRFSIEY